MQLGVLEVPADPCEAARVLVKACGRGVIVVVGQVPPGGWDHTVRVELERMASCLVVMIQWGQEQERLGSPKMIQVDGSREDFDIWWEAMIQEAASRTTCESIAELDAWWSWADQQKPPVFTGDFPSLGEQTRGLLARLRLTGRSWPSRWMTILGSPRSWEELREAAAIREHGGHISLTLQAHAIEHEPTAEDYRQVAEALRSKLSHEPWALARAGVLYARAGCKEQSESCLSEAMIALDDGLARRDIWEGWSNALRRMPLEQRRSQALFAAELALDRDDIEASLELAHIAGGGDVSAPFEAHFALGRALLARGDVVGARVALERAYSRCATDEERGGVLAQLAEVAYTVGDLDRASRHAREAGICSTSPAVRLEASNTLGKILLARSCWSEAEAHFLENENAAAAAGLYLGVVRARVNRAIALLSRGQGETARAILEQVLEDATARRDHRATAFALSNLAVLAIDRHDYPQAIDLLEAAIDARRKLGDKVGLARLITNLAELRLRLGLLKEAEHTLAFGQQALRPALPPTRVAHFALVAARIRLAHGDTFEASRQIGVALANGSGSSDGAMMGECHRVEARIALEDGDVQRAARAIELAQPHASEPYARAEIAWLQAKLSQAAGQDPRQLASEALDKARQANDEDLLRDAHLLIAELHRIDGRAQDARRSLEEAKRIRDHIVGALPSALQARYLARRDMHRLMAVEDAIRKGESETSSDTDSVRPAADKDATRLEPCRFIGRHPTVLRLLAAVEKVAKSNAPVLVLGESGTGKELIAEALHHRSDRRSGPLVKVNCAALVDTLLLSELFGHEKGAFTGATARRRGRFEVAEGGTLFLDEIGDISPKTQVALLRVLQDGTYERVGGGATLHANVRVVCATHRDLAAMVAQGNFREDLFYRLSGVTLRVSPLRERLSDLNQIAQHLLEQIATERGEKVKHLSADALALLHRHRWPGNVRELDNVLRAASLFSETQEISVHSVLEHIPTSIEPVSTPTSPLTVSAPSSVPTVDSHHQTLRLAYDQIRTQGTSLSDLKRNIERECIRQALADSEGNITRAAALLGMKRPRLSQLVKQYSLLEGLLEDPS